MASGDAPFSGQVRQWDGVTVYAESDDGQEATFVRAGEPLRQSLRIIADALDALPGRWYVTVISTPTTILRDLRGQRQLDQHLDGTGAEPRPEAVYLGLIGRLDLLRGGGRVWRKAAARG